MLGDATYGFSAKIPALVLAQLRAAGHLILTKAEALSPLRLAVVAATLRAINAVARVSAASHDAACALSDLAATALTLTGEDQPMLACMLMLPVAADWPPLYLLLSGVLHRNGDKLLRIKGVIRSPAGRLLIQTVRQSVHPPENLPEGIGADNELTIIGHGFQHSQVFDPSL
ncbi:MAG: GTP-binding protein [Candidatus Saccharibacteria bacterium]|nr:GTP-binding protein [Pseudorhodobacter sp.]